MSDERFVLLFNDLQDVHWDLIAFSETWREKTEEIWTTEHGHTFCGSDGQQEEMELASYYIGGGRSNVFTHAASESVIWTCMLLVMGSAFLLCICLMGSFRIRWLTKFIQDWIVSFCLPVVVATR